MTTGLWRKLAAAAAAFAVFAASAIAVSAAPEDADPPSPPESVVVDDMSSASAWTPDGVDCRVDAMHYGTETEFMSSGASDSGYVSVRDYSARTNAPVSVSRTFYSPVDLYAYDYLSFYISVTDSGALGGGDVSGYKVSITLMSGKSVYTYDADVETDGWQLVSAPVGEWNMRSRIESVTLSLTATAPADAAVMIGMRLDALSASGIRDTSFEDRYMCMDFESVTAAHESYDAFERFLRTTGSASVHCDVSIFDRDAASEAESLRITVSDSAGADIYLELGFDTGETRMSEIRRIPASGIATALYFRVSDIGSLCTLTIHIDTTRASDGAPASGGETRIYSIGLWTPPTVESGGIGSLDTCRVVADGVNIRGSVPSDVVASYMDGEIAILCIPVYGDAEQYIADAVPVATIDMTTRFNVTTGADALPSAYRAMRYAAVILRGDERILIGSPRFADFSDEVGVHLPVSAGSIKGVSGDGGAVMTADVVLDELFGTATTGKLYSFGGNLYYFNNEYLAALDGRIKPLSLSGASCYLRICDRRADGAHMIGVGDEESFERIYAAVDYLTSRYSGSDYGYIRGVIVGDDVGADICGYDDSVAHLAAMTVSTVYRIGRGNIAGFEVILPIGGALCAQDRPNGVDAADVLSGMSVYMAEFGGVPYSVLTESQFPIEMAGTASSFFSSMESGAPAGQFSIYKPRKRRDDAVSLLRDYIEKYYALAARGDVFAFIYDTSNVKIATDEYAEFMSQLSLLDTDGYASALEFAGVDVEPPERSHPIRLSTGQVRSISGTLAGSYELFDFKESFDSAGWFSINSDGECTTVKAPFGERGNRTRALRADEDCLGMMYSCAFDPIDLSAASVIRLDCRADEDAYFDLIVYSTRGVYRAEMYVRPFGVTYYADISEMAGLDSVTGFAILPRAGSEKRTLYLSDVSICSRTHGDGELYDMYSSSLASAEGADIHEENMIEIMAVAMAAIAVGASSTALFRRGREKRGVS